MNSSWKIDESNSHQKGVTGGFADVIERRDKVPFIVGTMPRTSRRGRFQGFRRNQGGHALREAQRARFATYRIRPCDPWFFRSCQDS